MSRKKPKNFWTKTKLKQWEKSFVKWGQFYELHKLMIISSYEPYKNDKVNAAIKLISSLLQIEKHSNPRKYKLIKAGIRMKLDQDTVDEITRQKLN
jgi:hypothetical protein